MRLDARVDPGASEYSVWDCEQCRKLLDVAWVDDESNEYGRYVYPLPTVKPVQVRKVEIIPELKLVYINPPLDLKSLVTEEQEVLCLT